MCISTYAFDQSVYVINAVKSLISEGTIGAILTGLMVLLFLGDLRGALIVIMTIPTSIISGYSLFELVWANDQYHDIERVSACNWHSCR